MGDADKTTKKSLAPRPMTETLPQAPPYHEMCLPANAFVYIPSTSECLSISSNDGHKGQKGCHQTLDANLLSPLFLQFFAWKNLMRLNKEIKDTMETGTDVNKMNVLGLIKNASENTLISMQRNTIIPNYKLKRSIKRRSAGTAAFAAPSEASVECMYSPYVNYENRLAFGKRGHHKNGLLVSSVVSMNGQELPDVKGYKHMSRSQRKLIEEANQYTQRHSFLHSKESTHGHSELTHSGSGRRRRSKSPAPEENGMAEPEIKRAKTLDHKRKVVTKNKEKFLEFIKGRHPFVNQYIATVPQDTKLPCITVFSGALVVCVLSRRCTIIGRKGTREDNVDLDLGTLGANAKSVSHKHCTITWDDTSRYFVLQGLSENPFLVDNKTVCRGEFVPLHDKSKILIHHVAMELEVPNGFSYPIHS